MAADNADDLIISISADQATLRRSIQRIERDIGGLAGTVKKSFDAAGKSIDTSMTTALQQRVNAMVGIGVTASKEWGGALADQGKELDRLKAKYSPLFATQKTYLDSLKDIKAAHALGAISSSEMTAAIQKQKAAFADQVTAIKGRNAALKDAAANRNNFAATNASYQFQDIITQAVGGSNISTITAQQAPQLAMALKEAGGGAQGLKAVGQGLLALVGPSSLVAVGITAATAAAVAFGVKALDAFEAIESIMKKHEDTMKRIQELYDNAGKAGEQFGRQTQTGISYFANQDQTALRKQLAKSLTAFQSDAGSSFFVAPQAEGLGLPEVDPEQVSRFGKYSDTVKKFLSDLQDGNADVLEFNRQIQEIANTDPTDKALQKTATRILELTKDATEAATALDELNKKRRELEIAFSRTAAAENQKKYLVENADKLADMQRQQAAALSAIGAKTPDQLAAAARARVAAEPINGNESVDVRQARIDAAGILAKAEAEQQLADAQKERAITLSRMLADQQNELDLVGKTGGAAEALKKQYDLIAQLRDEAARTGNKVDEAEIQAIKDKTEQYGKLADAISAAKLSVDLNRDAADALLSDRQRRIVQMQRQYGLPEDANSATGQQIGSRLDQQQIAGYAEGFLTDFASAAQKKGTSLGEAFGDAVKNAALSASNDMLKSLFGQIANGFASAVMGGKGSATSALLDKASGIIGTAPIGKVERGGPLPDVGAYANAIKSIESSGNYGALGPITKSGDRAYGAYQVMGANIPDWSKQALGYSLTPQEFLANKDAQDAIFAHRFGGYADKYGPSGAAQAWFGGPGSVGKGGMGTDILGTSGNEYVAKFTKQLGTATNELSTFGNGLGQLGSSLSSSFFPAAPAGGGGGFGSFLSSIFGGVSSIPAKFAGSAQAVAAFSGSGLFADGGHVAGPGTGTSDSIPAWLSNGEFVVNAKATKKNRKMLEAINTGRVGHFAVGGMVGSVPVPVAPTLTARGGGSTQAGSGPGVLVVRIDGANGDDHVRMLTKQGVSEGISQYNQQQQRGGLGTLQGRFNSQKA
ncbi:phage tail length tape measure family protein [Oryzifoliimicrobium ureilyticus]|uniref:phage tail length tape measure family protein n=1 Tax=Oryzifoliimicrobium ureilyticus TaxID=3113724 RepID=UPI0030765961